MKKNFFIRLKEFLIKIPPAVLLIFLIQAGFILVFGKLDVDRNKLLINSNLFIAGIIKTFFVIGIIFWLIVILSSFGKRISGVIRIVLIYIYILLILFHYHTGVSLDFSIMWDFGKEIFYPELLQMIYNILGVKTILALFLFTLLMIVGGLKWKLFSTYLFNQKKILQLLLLSVFLFILYEVPVKSYDEISSFSRSVISWYRIKNIFSDYDASNAGSYPYKKSIDSKFTGDLKELPNIFFITIESFNAHFVEKKTHTGKEITPFFNSLINKGLYIEHFYSNSVITVKGHLSLLFSILPSFRGIVFENYPDINLQPLPKILKDFGYKTIYYQAASSLKFQNEGPFLAKNGFDICKAAYSSSSKDIAGRMEELQGGWGGYNDDILYNQFFESIDSLHNLQNEGREKYFGFISTIYSHWPWLRDTSNNSKLPYPKPNSVEEDYSNVIFRVDSNLKLFFGKLQERKFLENSIIIITGDHSHPVNEHGSFINCINCYDENFKTPFLMIWENKLPPRRLTENAWSQIDVAPSILDLLNIRVSNHFIGKSFMGEKIVNGNVVYLVQPYSGLFFGAIMYPYKYSMNVSDNTESFYNLANDPNETQNNISNNNAISEEHMLKNKLNIFGLNQYLIEHNKIWPYPQNHNTSK